MCATIALTFTLLKGLTAYVKQAIRRYGAAGSHFSPKRIDTAGSATTARTAMSGNTRNVDDRIILRIAPRRRSGSPCIFASAGKDTRPIV